MIYPLVRFVDAPDPAAVVRFDFNAAGVWADDRTWPRHDGFSIGVPLFEGDPGGVGVSYGDRELVFNQVITGSDATVARVISALSRELLRPTNWLLFQKSAESEPVWFKTYTSQPGELDFTQVRNDREGNSRWGLGVSLVADPFAYGARITIPTATINNDPAAVSNPMSYVLPEIVGDAPAPLTLGFMPTGQARTRTMLSVAPVSSDFAGPYMWGADEFTASTDTGAFVADLTYAADGYRSVSFTTAADFTTRLTGAIPTPPPSGRYKILVRVGRTDTSSEFDLGLTLNSRYEGPKVRVSGTSDTNPWHTWVDLGDFDLPPGGSGGTIGGVTTGDPWDVYLYLSAARISGTSPLRIDAILAVPVTTTEGSARTLIVDGSEAGIGADNFGHGVVVDGDDESVVRLYYFGTLNQLSERHAYPLAGEFPLVHPGATNVLHIAPHVDDTAVVGNLVAGVGDNGDAITTTTTLEFVSYHPRWLYLGAD